MLPGTAAYAPFVDPMLSGTAAYASRGMPYGSFVDPLYTNPAITGAYPAALGPSSMYGGLYNRYAYNPYNCGVGLRGWWSARRWPRSKHVAPCSLAMIDVLPPRTSFLVRCEASRGHRPASHVVSASDRAESLCKSPNLSVAVLPCLARAVTGCCGGDAPCALRPDQG